MNQSSVFLTVLRKDVRLFWLFAALTALMLFLSRFPAIVDAVGQLAGLLGLVMQFGVLGLILAVCYEDNTVSPRHDWLTRPIAGTTLLAAKATFLFLAIVVPCILGTLLDNLLAGHSVVEALLAGVTRGANGGLLLIIVCIMAFASMTSSFRQGLIVFVGLVLILTVLGSLAVGISGAGESVSATGSVWVLAQPVMLVLFVLGLAVLWIQYRHRNTRASLRLVVACVLVGTLLVTFMTWSRIFGVQRALSPDPAAAEALQVSLVRGCFPVREVDANTYPQTMRNTNGPDAVGFSTQLSVAQIPPGHRLGVSQASLRWQSSLGFEYRTRPASTRPRWHEGGGGTLIGEHFWLLSKDTYTRLASDEGMQARLNYGLHLMAPAATATFAADGRRGRYTGVGFCSADFDRAAGRVDVECFNAGAQPAQLVANLEGGEELQAVPASPPDFVPALLNFWGGRIYRMQLRTTGNAVPRVTVTAYTGRVYFERSFDVPGVLGGAVSACPVK